MFCESIGVGLVDQNQRCYPSAAAVIDAGIDDQRISLTMRVDRPTSLAIRNLRAEIRSEFEICDIALSGLR